MTLKSSGRPYIEKVVLEQVADFETPFLKRGVEDLRVLEGTREGRASLPVRGARPSRVPSTSRRLRTPFSKKGGRP
jgi:hypothetical protein